MCVSLCGNIVLNDMVVVDVPLNLNMLLGIDYICAMNVVVSRFTRLMYFPYNKSIIIIDYLASNSHHPCLNLVQNSSWYVPSV